MSIIFISKSLCFYSFFALNANIASSGFTFKRSLWYRSLFPDSAISSRQELKLLHMLIICDKFGGILPSVKNKKLEYTLKLKLNIKVNSHTSLKMNFPIGIFTR